MRKILFILIFYLLYVSCKHKEGKIIRDNYIPVYSSGQIAEKLKNYYKAGSPDSLLSFLNEWRNIIRPATQEYINQNDTISNLFHIFTDLYMPFGFGNYKAINYFDWKNKFIIIQNEVNYAVISKREYKRIVYNTTDVYPNDTAYEFYRKTKKLLNFRPPLALGNIDYLYLPGEYKQGINDFLALGTFQGDIFLNDTLLSRYKFLCPALPILYGHWGGYCHLETLPIIDRIIFDNKFEHAAVDFRVSLEETVLRYRIVKKSGHWCAEDKWLKIRME